MDLKQAKGSNEMHSEANLSTPTTLYDLMTALQTQVDDEVIAALAVHLLRTGCITFLPAVKPSALYVSGATA